MPTQRVLHVWLCPPHPSFAERERYAPVGVFLVFGALPFNQTRKHACRRVLRVCYCPLRPSSAERKRYALVGVSLVFGALFLHPDT